MSGPPWPRTLTCSDSPLRAGGEAHYPVHRTRHSSHSLRAGGQSTPLPGGIAWGLRILWACLSLSYTDPALAQAQTDSDALQTLIRQARAARLDESRPWHLLLHYRRRPFGGVASEVNDPAFFLAKTGPHDPKAEIEATLAAFFAPLSGESQHPQCRFPARYAWLASQLDFASVPPQSCERFDRWRKRLNAASVTLIFAAADLSNPASMYGHTFLRFNHRDHGAGERLLDYTVNFSAVTDTQSGLAFAYHGLTGGYSGRFSTLPYHVKVREYANLQNRDLWEYDLALRPEEIAQLVRHLWEMGSASFDYYFLTQNCAYQLLPLLEVASPSLHLVERFGWVIPIDTVRILLMQPGLISAIRYRPSDWSRLVHKRSRLAPDDASIAHRIAAEGEMALPDVPPAREAAILDVAYDALQYRGGDKAVERDLLLRMQALPRAPDSEPPPPPIRPDAGHKTGRIGIGLGRATQSRFTEIAIRPALHDLTAPDDGYLPNSHLEMFHLRLRYAPRERAAWLERLGLIEVISLHPHDPWSRQASWKIHLRIEPARERGCVRGGRCLYLGMNMGRGMALSGNPGWTGLKQAVGYVFVEMEAGVGGPFAHRHRLGGGATAGLLLSVSPALRLHLEGSSRHFVVGDRHAVHSVQAEQRVSVGKDWELRLALRRASANRETLATLHRYF